MEKTRCAACNAEIQPQHFYNRSTLPPVEGTQLVCTACLEKARSVVLPATQPPAPAPGPSAHP